eukprot:2356797-Pleurochrysis_carterae.AAC.1
MCSHRTCTGWSSTYQYIPWQYPPMPGGKESVAASAKAVTMLGSASASPTCSDDVKCAPPDDAIRVSRYSSCAVFSASGTTRSFGSPEPVRCGLYNARMECGGDLWMHRKCSRTPTSARYSEKSRAPQRA